MVLLFMFLITIVKRLSTLRHLRREINVFAEQFRVSLVLFSVFRVYLENEAKSILKQYKTSSRHRENAAEVIVRLTPRAEKVTYAQINNVSGSNAANSDYCAFDIFQKVVFCLTLYTEEVDLQIFVMI